MRVIATSFSVLPSIWREALAVLVVLASAGFAGCDEAMSEDFGLADVSFLVPLDAPLVAGSLGGHGVLLPRAHFDGFEMLTRTDEPDALYAAMHVVGVRLDACFFEGVAGAAGPVCSAQIRLVFQPVFPAEAGQLETRDAAMHAFYAVPRSELRALAVALAVRREAAGGAAQALEVTAIVDALPQLLLPYIGEERLTRVTAMSVHPTGQAWVFSGKDVHDGSTTDIAIQGVAEHDEHLTSKGGVATLDASLIPEPAIEPDIAAYLDAARRPAMSPTEVLGGIAEAVADDAPEPTPELSEPQPEAEPGEAVAEGPDQSGGGCQGGASGLAALGALSMVGLLRRTRVVKLGR